MNTATHNIDALLFDLGGVLIDVHFDKAMQVWGGLSTIEASLLQSRFAIDAFYERHERGEIGASEYFASLRNSLGINLSDAEFEHGWNAILGEEIRETTALLSKLKHSAPLYLFSNSNATHHQYWMTKFAPMLNHFERIFVSSDIGMRKPEPDAFFHIAGEIGVPLSRILFFDDTEENVLGARHVGMQTVHVTSSTSVRNAVTQFV